MLRLFLRNTRSKQGRSAVEELINSGEIPRSGIEIEGVISAEKVPWIAATIVVNGQQTTSWFLVDTGASIIIVSPTVAQVLGINFDPSNTVIVPGLLADKFQIPCNLVSAELYFKGKGISPDTPIFVKTPVELYVPSPDSITSYCILGRDVLNEFDYEIGFAQKKLRLDVRKEPNGAISVVTSIPTFKQD